VVSLALSASLLAPSSSVSAATGINHQINFQGKLVNPDGTNVTDGSYSIVYSIYSVPTAGAALWTETQTVTLTNGIFQVNLGSVTSLPGSVDFNTDNIYLGIKVGADAEMTPRVQFTSVPQAFNAEKLGGVDKTGFIQNTTSPQTASFNVTGSGAIGTTLAVTGATTLSSTLAVTGASSFTGTLTANGGIATTTLSASGLASLNGGATVTGTTNINTTGTATTTIGNTTGATAVNINAGTGNINLGGNTAATGSLALQGSNGEVLSNFNTAGALTSYGTGQSILGLATPVITLGSGTAGTTYYYVVSATNAAGETVASNSLGTTTNTVTLNWTQVPGATGYKVYRNTTNSFTAGSLLLSTITNGTTVSFTDSGAVTVAGLPTTAPVGTGLVIQGWSAQSSKLLDIRNASGTTVASVFTNGGASFSGNVFSQSATSSGAIISQNSDLTVGSSTATRSIVGRNGTSFNGLYLGDGSTYDSNLYRASAALLRTNAALTVDGATTLSSTLAVTGTTTLTGALTANGGTTTTTLAATGSLTQTAGATISAGTGYKINGAAATAGTFLRGDGTNFVASTLQSGDITGGSANYIQNGTTQQANSNFNISGAGVVGTTLSVAGTSSFSGAINLGAASTTTGQIKLYTSTNTGSVTLQGAATNGNYTVSIPNTIAANDTICLLTVANCGSSINVGALNGGTANANGATVSGGSLYLQSASSLYAGVVDIAAQTFAGAKTFKANTTVATTSSAAFQVQNAGGNSIFGVDTSAGQALLGKASTINGALALYNATNANSITIQTGVTSASYTITLAAAAGTAGQCLTVASVVAGNQTLGYGSCGGGGGGTQAITLAPEFAGATFSASGTNNVGTMYSDHVGGLALAQGYKHNYYQWSTDQATAQNYDVVASYQLPSNFSSFAGGTFKIWVYADSLTSTDINFDLRSNTDADCYASVQSVKPSASGTWQQVTIADPGNGCSFAANDVITIDIKPTAITPNTNYVKIGELQFRYN
jgi:fibronectin-binding autotransporter adhesin